MVIRQSRITLLLMLAYLFYFSGAGYSQVGKLFPVDEAARDASLFILRARLLEAIQRRDTAFILSCLSPDIVSSFGGDNGLAEFKEEWKPDQPNSKLWSTLATVLALGGSFQNDKTFAAPYTFSRFPDRLDPFEHGVILGENVRVRKTATVDSSVVASLSFDVVAVMDWGTMSTEGSKQGWVKVKLVYCVKQFVTYFRA